MVSTSDKRFLPMKVTILQMDIKWASPEENVSRAERLLEEHSGSDLYVLPEMWSTGFAVDSMEAAGGEDSVALAWMKATAARRHCALSGSLLVRLADGSCRNRHYFVTENSCTVYDKHHLFTYGHEERHIQAGQEHVIADYQGRRFLLLTCYDLRFPLWSRYGMAGEYDAIIVVANWPESRQQAWRVLTRARAVENQCFLIGCNRVGDDKFCHYVGESLVCDSWGETLAVCDTQQEEAKTIELDFASQDKVRTRFRVLDDRD